MRYGGAVVWGKLVAVGSVLAALLGSGGCGEEPQKLPELVVAEVGDAVITVAEFKAFNARIPEGMKQGESHEAVRRNVLESLIDKTLLVLEGASTEIEQDPSFKKDLARYERSQLMNLYVLREVVAKIQITAEEVQQLYRESGRDRALRLGGIMLASLQEAENIIARLNAGEEFFALAGDHSLHESSAVNGGDSGIYQVRDQMSPATVEQVLKLQVGQVSAPVLESFHDGDYYIVYKILDEIPAPLSASQKVVVEELTLRKRAERLAALGDSLHLAYAPKVRDEAVALLVERAVYGEITLKPDDGDQILCTYGDRELTLQGFIDKVEAITERKARVVDRAQATAMLHERILPDLLFAAEIKNAGLRQDSLFVADLHLKREELALDALRQQEVGRHLSVSDEEIRRFYDEHPEKFTMPETIVAIEILVAADTLAQRLAQALKDGADPGELAIRHTLREGALHHGGTLNLNLYTQSFFPDIYRVVQGMQPGQVGGPLKIDAGYSVFKVIDRTKELTPFNDEAKRRARAYVHIDKSKRGYVEFVRDLRQKYPVKIIEENLQKI
jgi:parvulin-like peptidyl-prolyl isomerase